MPGLLVMGAVLRALAVVGARPPGGCGVPTRRLVLAPPATRGSAGGGRPGASPRRCCCGYRWLHDGVGVGPRARAAVARRDPARRPGPLALSGDRRTDWRGLAPGLRRPGLRPLAAAARRCSGRSRPGWTRARTRTLRVVSACAGDGRDLLEVLARRPADARPGQRLAARARRGPRRRGRAHAAAHDLATVDVRRVGRGPHRQLRRRGPGGPGDAVRRVRQRHRRGPAGHRRAAAAAVRPRRDRCSGPGAGPREPATSPPRSVAGSPTRASRRSR